MVVFSFEVTWWELTGLLGAALYASNYLCVACDKWSSRSRNYYLSQFIAAGAVLVSLSNSFNIASVFIQVFFIVVSIIGFVRHSRVAPDYDPSELGAALHGDRAS